MLDVTGNSVLSFGPGVGVATANAAYVTSINSNLGQGGYNSTRITVDFDSDHLLSVGNVINMSGLDPGIDGFSRADGNFLIDKTSSRVEYLLKIYTSKPGLICLEVLTSYPNSAIHLL